MREDSNIERTSAAVFVSSRMQFIMHVDHTRPSVKKKNCRQQTAAVIVIIRSRKDLRNVRLTATVADRCNCLGS